MIETNDFILDMIKQLLDVVRGKVLTVSFGFFAVLSVFQVILYIRLCKSKKVNPYIYSNMPNVFVAVGIVGTFVGILLGLQKFDPGNDNLTQSVTSLLDGLKTSFYTSVAGLILSIFFKWVSGLFWHRCKLKKDEKDLSEGEKLLKQIVKALGSDGDASLLSQLKALRVEQKHIGGQNTDALQNIQDAVGDDDDTSLLSQIQGLRDEQKVIGRQNTEALQNIHDAIGGIDEKSLLSQFEALQKKFDEFSELLAKKNTEALAVAMKKYTKQFNEQMKEIIGRLVKENFETLNDSVKNMIDWQQDNKKMIESLTRQFNQVCGDFETSSVTMRNIAEQTARLTSENSHLTKLIKTLQEVMIEDTKYTDITNKLTATIDTLKDNTSSFANTTNKLNDWIHQHKNFEDSISILMSKLEGVQKIKDINEVFWNNTKTQLEEGVGMIKSANETYNNEFEKLNDEFYERLNTSLMELDNALRRIVERYEDKKE